MRTLLCAALLLSCGKSEPTQQDKPVQHGGTPTHEDRREPATSAPELVVEVTIQGTKTTWRRDAFERVPHPPTKNNAGEARDVWSLRDLAHQLVGPTARVVSIHGLTATATITPEAWADPARTPILHTTRRGTLKFRWAGTDGAWLEPAVNDVSSLVVE